MNEEVQAELDRIKANIAAAYSEAEVKGAEIPEDKNSSNLAETIRGIPEGTGGSTLTESDAVAIAIETGLIDPPLTADDGSIYTDENGDVYIL